MIILAALMMRILSLILFIVLVASCHSDSNLINTSIDDIGATLAPDKRVAIFDATFENGELTGETNLPEAKEKLNDLANENNVVDNVLLLSPTLGMVNVSVCNIRSDARHSAELSTQSLLGTIVNVYKKRDNWYLVQTPDGYLGWLDQGAFVHIPEDRFLSWKKSEKIVVKNALAFIYQVNSDGILSDIVEGNILEVTGRENEWTLIQLPDGRSGRIRRESTIPYTQFIHDKDPISQDIIETANHFMGRPYLWGGTSGKGMDCSGFTKTVFYLNGLELPRDASQQVHTGVKIELDSTLVNLEPADFLFFGRKKSESESEKITHVAIYLGEGKIIHASDRIQVESLRRGDPDFTEKRLLSLVRAKRMLQNIGENGVRRLADHPLYSTNLQ